MSKRRGVQLHRNQASHELDDLMARGKVTRRWAIVGGKRGWLYKFTKQ